MQASRCFLKQIDFMPRVVTPEIEVGRLPRVEPLLDLLRDYPCFEQCAASCVGGDALRVANAKKPSHQPNVEKIQLRRFDQSLAKVVVIRHQANGQIACLENGQPFTRGHRRDTAIGPERREIEHLS